MAMIHTITITIVIVIIVVVIVIAVMLAMTVASATVIMTIPTFDHILSHPNITNISSIIILLFSSIYFFNSLVNKLSILLQIQLLVIAHRRVDYLCRFVLLLWVMELS